MLADGLAGRGNVAILTPLCLSIATRWSCSLRRMDFIRSVLVMICCSIALWALHALFGGGDRYNIVEEDRDE